mmetsp:Transcript_28680/g.72626  ORF Transcript_28680/g.72626 Transcript_28680/m.72626 type:complete len:225 (-) Transcript_28680:695-1369(-)
MFAWSASNASQAPPVAAFSPAISATEHLTTSVCTPGRCCRSISHSSCSQSFSKFRTRSTVAIRLNIFRADWPFLNLPVCLWSAPAVAPVTLTSASTRRSLSATAPSISRRLRCPASSSWSWSVACSISNRRIRPAWVSRSSLSKLARSSTAAAFSGGCAAAGGWFSFSASEAPASACTAFESPSPMLSSFATSFRFLRCASCRTCRISGHFSIFPRRIFHTCSS